MTIEPGTAANKTFTVSEDDTAIALGSGDVPVLATPRLIAWCEEVTVLALQSDVDPASTTVGYKVRVDHSAPTVVGRRVEVGATVAAVDGRQVVLEVEVAEGDDRVASGTITRVVVDRERFLANAKT